MRHDYLGGWRLLGGLLLGLFTSSGALGDQRLRLIGTLGWIRVGRLGLIDRSRLLIRGHIDGAALRAASGQKQEEQRHDAEF